MPQTSQRQQNTDYIPVDLWYADSPEIMTSPRTNPCNLHDEHDRVEARTGEMDSVEETAFKRSNDLSGPKEVCMKSFKAGRRVFAEDSCPHDNNLDYTEGGLFLRLCQERMVESLALCSEITLSVYIVPSMLITLNKMLVPTLLYGAQTWTNI